MITREKIRRMAGYSFSRGEDIYRRGKITKFEVERCGNNDRIFCGCPWERRECI